jgi:selenocysteine-specific elongation factor
MLAHPDALAPSHLIDASFRYLRTSRGPLGPRSRVLVHHGTSQLTATLVLVDTEQLAPGQEALVQLRLDIDTPLAALPGDRFIARGFVIQEHYGTTIGGGEILRVHAPKSKRSSARSAEALEAIARASADERVALEIKASDSAGMTVDTIVARLGLPQPELVATLARLAERGDVVVAGRGATALYCHAEPLARLEKRAVDALAQFHETQPERDAMPREELRARLAKALAPRMFDQVVAALERREAIVADRDQVRQAGARTRAGQATVDALDEKVAAVYRDGGITPVRPQDVPAQVGRDAKDVRAASDRLLAAGQLVRVKSDFHVDAGALGALREKLVAHLDAHGEITPGQWKQITGASRKFSIPLAEYFDAEKLTLRVGDVRKRRG